MKDTTIAVGLAKNVFEIAISREAGKVSKYLAAKGWIGKDDVHPVLPLPADIGTCAFYLFIRASRT